MEHDFYIVNKKILPDCLDKVIKAREMLRTGEVREVSEAVKKVGISRSTYYKYKDFVFLPKVGDDSRRMLISMMVDHEPGVLGRVLSFIGDAGGNIVTINQNPPIGNRVNVVVLMEVGNLRMDSATFIESLTAVKGVEESTIVDMA